MLIEIETLLCLYRVINMDRPYSRQLFVTLFKYLGSDLENYNGSLGCFQ